MHIAIITGNYPSPSRPVEGTFVQQFVWAMARQGHDCSVIKPTSLLHRRYGPLPPTQSLEEAGAGHRVAVYRPRYFSLGSKDLRLTHSARWTLRTFRQAARSAVLQLPRRPDLLYGHFLYLAGCTAVSLGARLAIPAVVAVGEGTFWTVAPFGFARARRDFSAAAGFIAVASHIRAGLREQLGVGDDRVVVEPNGVDLTRFYPRDRVAARRQLGLDPTRFLVAFVGAFDELKGGRELVRATQDLDRVGLVLLGQGPVDLTSDQVLFKGRVAHADVPVWLAAADIFVLPTREEGSSNAVLEALACGLPVVTANGEYMDDIVDDQVALRVDPRDVGQIREAIRTLAGDPARRQQMSAACLARARRFDINERARRVTSWAQERVQACKRH